jgi:hypothetical protein
MLQFNYHISFQFSPKSKRRENELIGSLELPAESYDGIHIQLF